MTLWQRLHQPTDPVKWLLRLILPYLPTIPEWLKRPVPGLGWIDTLQAGSGPSDYDDGSDEFNKRHHSMPNDDSLDPSQAWRIDNVYHNTPMDPFKHD